MKAKLISLAIAGLFVSSTVVAEDKSWTGLKIGIGAGGSSSQAKTTNSGSHQFNEASDYETDSTATSDSVVTNTFNSNSTFNSNHKFNPSSTGDDNDHVVDGSSGVIHGDFDNNDVQYTETPDVNTARGTNYYNRDYAISEGFVGQAFDSLNLGRAGGFGTLDVTYDWQLGDSFVFGLTASANISSKQVAKGAASGYNDTGWSESLSYGLVENTSSTSGGGSETTSYDSVVTSESASQNPGQLAYTGMQSSFETGNSFDMGARLGFLPTNNTLLFVSGGFSVIKVNQNTSYISGAMVGDQDSIYGESGSGNSYYHSVSKTSSGFKPGYFVGAGIETRLTDDVSLKLEYRYSDYGSMKSGASSNNASIQDGVNTNDFEFYNSLGGAYNMSQKTDLTTQSIRAVLSYNF